MSPLLSWLFIAALTYVLWTLITTLTEPDNHGDQ